MVGVLGLMFISGLPMGFGENGYLFSGSWGALVIIFASS